MGTYNFYYLASLECIIVAIDREPVFGGKSSSLDTVEMLPGEHEVTILLHYNMNYKLMFGSPRSSTRISYAETFSFVAEAGHVYKADGNWHGGDVQIYIIDKETGKVVAGMKSLPLEKNAKLKGKRFFFTRLCAIEAVDSKIMLGDFTMEAEMLPGKHEVTIKVSKPFRPPVWRFSFVAEAGHVYQVEAWWKAARWRIVDNQIWVYIVDKETGHVVAGQKP